MQQRGGAVVLGLGDGADLGFIAVVLVHLDGEAVPHLFAQNLLAEGRFLADQPLAGVAAGWLLFWLIAFKPLKFLS